MHCLAKVTVNDYSAINITSTSMTLTWRIPDIAPISYEINTTCTLNCSNLIYFGDSEITDLPPFIKSGMPPYSQCMFHLTGLYEDDNVSFSQYSATTLLAGKTIQLCFVYDNYIINSSFFISQ